MKLIKIIFIISLLNLTLFLGISLLQSKQINRTISAALPSAVPSVASDNRCIITIDNQKYDVTFFRTIHSGGDVFQCGSDMSFIFHQQHNQRYLGLMSMYKI